MKRRQHATRCSLFSPITEYATNIEQIILVCKSFFHTFHGLFLTDFKTLIRVPLWLFAYPSSHWGECSPLLHWTERKVTGLDEVHSPAVPCHLETVRSIGRLHDSLITVHIFQVTVHFSGCFPRFKVKFNHATLLHVDTFDTRNKHINFDGAKTTPSDAIETSPCSSSGKNHLLFC